MPSITGNSPRLGRTSNSLFFDLGRRPFYAELSYDPLVALFANSSLLLVCVGHLDQALSRGHRALQEARQLSRPEAVAMAMSHRWQVGWWIRSNAESLLQDADQYLAFATEHGLGPHQALGAYLSRVEPRGIGACG
jgi:hypothetical protein